MTDRSLFSLQCLVMTTRAEERRYEAGSSWHRIMIRLALLCSVVVGAVAAAQDAGVLIPREVLFGNPEKGQPRLSPDGKKLGFLAPDDHDVLQVWVKTLGTQDDAIVTADRKRGIRSWRWVPDSGGLLYAQDADGDENFHVFFVDLRSKNVRDLTPWQGVRAQLVATNPKGPDTVLVEANVRDRKTMDVYRINLRTGSTELDTQNPGDVSAWFVDSAFVVRGAQARTRPPR